MRKSLFAICILGVSCVLHAQAKSAWENLSVLQPGDKIQVRQLHAKKVIGIFLSFSDAAISLQLDRGSQSILKEDVVRVKRMKNEHRLRNSLILAGVGAGAGAGIGAAVHHGCSSSQAFCLDIGGKTWPAGIGAAIGVLSGAATGALLPSSEIIYTTKVP